jgi:hypothetical protein
MTNFKSKISAFSFASVVALGFAGSASAQGDSGSAEFAAYLKALTAATQPQKNVYLPGVAHAVVAPGGTGYASLSLFTPRGGVPGGNWDGSASFGIGFGNAETGVGGSLTLNTTGLSPFGTDGDFTLKFAKTIASSEKNKTTIGIGFNRLAPWGSNTSIPKSYDVSVTHFGTIPSASGGTPIMFTVGYGSRNINGGGAFGGVGFGLTEALGFGVSLKNSRITAGFGYKVKKVPGMSMSFDVSNINRAGPAASNSPVLTIGFNFSKPDLF